MVQNSDDSDGRESKQPAKSSNKKRKVVRDWRKDKRFSYSYEFKAQAVLYFDQLRERDMALADKKHCNRVPGLQGRYDEVNEKFKLGGRRHCIKHWTSKKGRADINAALQGTINFRVRSL